MLTEKIVGFHCLSIRHTGAHTSASLDRKEWTKFVHRKDGSFVNEIVQSRSNEFEAKEAKEVPVFAGTVTRPFHSFAGVDANEAMAQLQKIHCS